MNDKVRRILGFFVLAAGFVWLLAFGYPILINELLEGFSIFKNYIIVIWAMTIIMAGLTMILGERFRFLGFINMVVCVIALASIISSCRNTEITCIASFTELFVELLKYALYAVSFIPILDTIVFWRKERELAHSQP